MLSPLVAQGEDPDGFRSLVGDVVIACLSATWVNIGAARALERRYVRCPSQSARR
jgi:hypothetical protein